MKTIVSNKQSWFNKIKLTKDDEVYVGIDVHKKSYAVAVWLNAAPAIDFVMPADNQKVLTMLDKLRIALKQVVYEAGPTGYSLARLLQDAKLPIRVIAPQRPRDNPPEKARPTNSIAASWLNMPQKVCFVQLQFPQNSRKLTVSYFDFESSWLKNKEDSSCKSKVSFCSMGYQILQVSNPGLSLPLRSSILSFYQTSCGIVLTSSLTNWPS